MTEADSLMHLAAMRDRALLAEAQRDRLRDTLLDWWLTKRPPGWDEEQHRQYPFIGIGPGVEKRMVAALLGIAAPKGEDE